MDSFLGHAILAAFLAAASPASAGPQATAAGPSPRQVAAVPVPNEFSGPVVTLAEVNTLRTAALLPPLPLSQLQAVSDAGGARALDAATAASAARLIVAAHTSLASRGPETEALLDESARAVFRWRQAQPAGPDARHWLKALADALGPSAAALGPDDSPQTRAALDAFLDGRRPDPEPPSFDPKAGYFGPDSLMWRVNGHQAVFATGLRAYLMQGAHPLFAESTKLSRQLLRRPVPRLENTLTLMRQVMFGDLATARKAAAAINYRHTLVRGTLSESTGRFQAGQAFTAEDPKLLKWAWAALFDTSVLAYQRYVGHLSEAELDRYYAEYRLFGRLLSIPSATMPVTRAGFQEYLDGVLKNGDLAVGRAGLLVRRTLEAPESLHGPLKLLVVLLMAPIMLFTIGLLPPVVRSLYGFSWTPARKQRFLGLDAAVREAFSLMPRFLAYGSQWRKAIRRTTTQGDST